MGPKGPRIDNSEVFPNVDKPLGLWLGGYRLKPLDEGCISIHCSSGPLRTATYPLGSGATGWVCGNVLYFHEAARNGDVR